MKIVLSHHARLRLMQRGINEETVKYVLENADYIKTTFEGRRIAVKQINGKIRSVIYVEEEDKIIIITVY